MPVTILIPPEAGSPHPTGPGFAVAWEFIGPIPGNWTWNVRVLDDVNETIQVISHVIPAQATSQGMVLGEPMTTSTIPAAQYQTPHGSPAILQVRLLDEFQTVREIGNRAITYDTVSGQPHLTAVAASSSGQGGYTQTDRTVAQNTLTAVQTIFPSHGGLPSLAVDIGKFFAAPPVDVLRRAELLTLTGRGTLFYPAGGGDVQAYGAFIELVGAPSGAGFDDGVVTEYEVRIAQFSVVGRHGTTTGYVKHLYDLVHGGQYLQWGAPFPRKIDYFIPPGFSIGWRWLVLGIQS